MNEPSTVSPVADEAPFTADPLVEVPSPAANNQIVIELIDENGDAHPAELVALFAFEGREYGIICPLEATTQEPVEGEDFTLQAIVMRATEDGFEAIADPEEYARVVAELETEAEDDVEMAEADAAEQTA